MQQKLMKYDPVSGEERPYPSNADAYRAFHGKIVWLFNPWTGTPRDPRDIGSDPVGNLIIQSAETPTATPAVLSQCSISEYLSIVKSSLAEEHLTDNLLASVSLVRTLCAGDKAPNWANDHAVYRTRGRILDITEEHAKNIALYRELVKQDLREEIIASLLQNLQHSSAGINENKASMVFEKSPLPPFCQYRPDLEWVLNKIRFGALWPEFPVYNQTPLDQSTTSQPSQPTVPD